MNKKILLAVVIVVIVLVGLSGWIWFKNSGYWYFNYYVLHEGPPPGYCDPGPCLPPTSPTALVTSSTSPAIAPTSTSTTTTAWKTYQSAENTFEFKYPLQWGSVRESKYNTILGLGSVPTNYDWYHVIFIDNSSTDAVASVDYYTVKEGEVNRVLTINDFLNSGSIAQKSAQYTKREIDGLPAIQSDTVAARYRGSEVAMLAGYGQDIDTLLKTPDGSFMDISCGSPTQKTEGAAWSYDLAICYDFLSTFNSIK